MVPRSSLAPSSSECDKNGRQACVFENMCVDHTRHNRLVTLNDVQYMRCGLRQAHVYTTHQADIQFVFGCYVFLLVVFGCNAPRQKKKVFNQDAKMTS